MLFSIVTVVLNDRSGFLKTMNSVKQQTFKAFEWIVVDGGSSDGTIDLIKSADCVSDWISEHDSGIYDAMNKGIAKSSGDYLVFLNAGDSFSDEKVLDRVDGLISINNNVDIVFGGANLIFPGGKSVYREPRNIKRYIWHGVPANHQATYFSKKIIQHNHYDSRYKICGDYYLVAKLYTTGVKAIYLNLPLANFEVGGMSYNTPVKLFWESYLIQRDVLELPLMFRVVSFIKRTIATLGTVILSRSAIMFNYLGNTQK